ncbi:MAG: hypothetical protein C0514_06265 [Candidatus Puniceispirillum sp.]|nr:hypothetical protein [Candidatus Puniceispirillum sp.]
MTHAHLLAAATILTLHTHSLLASSQEDHSFRDEVSEQLRLADARIGDDSARGCDTRLRAAMVHAFWQQEAESRALSGVAHAQFSHTTPFGYSGSPTVIPSLWCADTFRESESWEYKDSGSDMLQYTPRNRATDLMGALQAGVVTHQEFKEMGQAHKRPVAGRSALVARTLLTRLLNELS